MGRDPIQIETSELLELYKSGMSLVEISRYYRESLQWVSKRLNSDPAYLKIKEKEQQAKDNLKELILSDFFQGLKSNKIAEKYNISNKDVLNLVRFDPRYFEWRKNNISTGAKNTRIPDEEIIAVFNLVKEGTSLNDALQKSGISRSTYFNRIKNIPECCN